MAGDGGGLSPHELLAALEARVGVEGLAPDADVEAAQLDELVNVRVVDVGNFFAFEEQQLVDPFEVAVLVVHAQRRRLDVRVGLDGAQFFICVLEFSDGFRGYRLQGFDVVDFMLIFVFFLEETREKSLDAVDYRLI